MANWNQTAKYRSSVNQFHHFGLIIQNTGTWFATSMFQQPNHLMSPGHFIFQNRDGYPWQNPLQILLTDPFHEACIHCTFPKFYVLYYICADNSRYKSTYSLHLSHIISSRKMENMYFGVSTTDCPWSQSLSLGYYCIPLVSTMVPQYSDSNQLVQPIAISYLTYHYSHRSE